MGAVVITGGSRGIGAATVEAFCAAGQPVAFFYARSEEAAREVARKTGALALRADVTDRARVFEAFDEARRALGPVETLVCNAGIAQFRLFDEITPEEWARMLDVNLTGAFHCVQAALRDMLPRKRGAIVTVSSMWGQVGASCEAHYAASKAGLIGLTRSLAKELGPSNIRVNCVAPGAIDTDMNAALDRQARDMLCDETPLGRLGAPEEVARAILYLSQPGSAFITGQVLGVSGGMVV